MGVTGCRSRQVGTGESTVLAEDGHDHPAAGVTPPGPGEEALQGQHCGLGCSTRYGRHPAPAPPSWLFPGMGNVLQTLGKAGATSITLLTWALHLWH